MTPKILVAVLVAAIAVLPSAAAAQTDTPKPSLERARQMLDDGRPAEALAMLRQLPASAEGTRLRVDASLAGGDFTGAIAAYEELAGRFKSPSPDVLAGIAAARARALRKDPDPQVRVAACDALLLAGASPECSAELLATANDASASLENRLAAANALVDHDAPGAAALVESIVRQGIQSSPAVTASLLADMPPAISNEPLKTLLTSDNADAQYLAALALARRRVRDAVPPLRAVATDTEAGAARLMAYIALAALGEPDGLRIVRETLPLLKGRDRLEAARALTAVKDPAGPPMLESLLNDERETLRIETAEALSASRSPRAGSTLNAGTESANPWVRASAIAAAARAGMPVTATVRRAVADSNAHVAAAAVRAILLDVRRRR